MQRSCVNCVTNLKIQMIPVTFEAWLVCITVTCGIELSPDFVSKRIAALKNTNDEHTRQLVRCYGQEHVAQLIQWFEKVQNSYG